MAIMTNYGMNLLADNDETVITYLAVGSGTVPTSATATDLGSEIERIAVTSLYVVGNTITAEALFAPSQGVGSITEVGLFSASSGSNLIAAVAVSPTKTKTSAESYLAIISITYANAS